MLYSPRYSNFTVMSSKCTTSTHSLVDSLLTPKTNVAINLERREYVGNHERLVTCDGLIRSGLGIHLTPTTKKRKVHGKEETQLKQGYCKVC